MIFQDVKFVFAESGMDRTKDKKRLREVTEKRGGFFSMLLYGYGQLVKI